MRAWYSSSMVTSCSGTAHFLLQHEGQACLVQLERGELGVVPRGHALVAEHAADLINALQAADRQALKVQLCAAAAGLFY
jgi:hypothetical protein